MYPLIGVIMRKSVSPCGHEIDYAYTDIETSIIKSGGIPLGIIPGEIDKYVNVCNGFVIEGGDDFTLDDFKMIKTIRDNNKPLLGICLGMQEMAYLYDGSIKDIPNHRDNEHEIIIEKDSLLYKILKRDKIIVNSRHKSAIIKSNIFVSARSTDGMIEAIEDKDKVFFLGLQWHPETDYDNDPHARKIFDYFIMVCSTLKE